MARNSRIIICKNIKLDKEYNNVLSYNETKMLALCTANAVQQGTNYSFIRSSNNVISVGFSYNDCLKCNYMAFENLDYSNKWFFAFIDSVEYVSDGNSKIHYTIDEFSTWFDYWNPKTCFVIREHVSNDTIGLHTIPENVETGEYVVQSVQNADLGSAHVVIASSWNPFTEKPGGSVVNGIYNGCDYFLLKENQRNDISYFMGMMSTQSKADAVLGLFMIPDKLTGYASISWDYMSQPEGNLAYYPYKQLPVSNSDSTNVKNMGSVTVSKNYSTINGYTPKNNKLFTSQFNLLMCSNNCGASALYNYEDFSSSSCVFNINGVITPGASIRCFPTNYKGITSNQEEGLTGAKYPVCSYNTDMYINWLTQNSVNVSIGNFDFDIKPNDISMATSIGSIAGGVGLLATGGGAMAGAGAIVSGGIGLANSVASIQQHQKIPPQFSGNINSGDVMYSMGNCDFTFRKLTIKKEYAQIIDDYFTRLGYKVNTLKVPNQVTRPYFNYVQIANTEDIGYSTNTTRSVPSSSMAVINSIYRRGVTLWHNHDYLGDYSVDNSI